MKLNLAHIKTLGRQCTRTQLFTILMMTVLVVLIIIQQLQINDLQYRLDYITSENKESYPSRLTNLEYIINAHTASIHESDDTLWYLKEQYNDLRWRVMQLEWHYPVK